MAQVCKVNIAWLRLVQASFYLSKPTLPTYLCKQCKRIEHVDYNMFTKILPYEGDGAMLKDLTPQFEGEKFKSSHLQFRPLS